ncbi:hypothetical protein [Amycolatopsis sp.]|uniref:hypothetical protein n=1 Tax=Amycolatopsis sp. TaxID=37632 RepID=UPI002B747F04|nr:hypothetical protein [Amycolatopsis sp.]HVV14098.1 hypothetical protein [Amycolatopsis sp.]
MRTGRARGTVVAEVPIQPGRLTVLEEAAARFATFARDLGVDAETAAAAVRAACERPPD